MCFGHSYKLENTLQTFSKHFSTTKTVLHSGSGGRFSTIISPPSTNRKSNSCQYQTYKHFYWERTCYKGTKKRFRVFLGVWECQKRVPRVRFTLKNGATWQRTFNNWEFQNVTFKLHTWQNIKVFVHDVTYMHS